MLLALRIFHIVTGVFWAGAVFFIISFLMPAFRAVGPDAAKVFAELRKRRMFNWVPAIAGLTVLSGFGLYGIRMMQGGPAWAGSREAQAFGLGAVTAILALIIGMVGMRANALKADDISRAAGPMPAGAEKDAKMAEAQRLRAKAMMSGRAAATFLLITVVAMAAAKYI